MPKDMKHLVERNGYYGINCRIPKNSGIYIPGNQLRLSLRTQSHAVAKRIRDRTIVPLMAEASRHAALVELVRQLCESSEESRRLIAKLAADAGVEQIAGIRSMVFDAVPLKDLFSRYLDYLKNGDSKSHGTYVKQKGTVKVWIEMLGPDRDAQTVTRADVIKARDELQKMPRNYFLRSRATRCKTPAPGQETLNTRTIKNHIMYLSKIYKWALSDGMISCENPAIGIEIELKPTKEKRCPTLAEADRLCALAKNSPSLGQFEWQTLPMITRYSGLRIEEACGLHAEDVITKNGIRCFDIHDRNHNLKTAAGASTRLVPIADAIADIVDAALKRNPTGRLFPLVGDSKVSGKNGVTFTTKFNLAAKAVAPDLSTHNLRVYANVRMAEAGVNTVDLERILGHESTSTQKHYTDRDLKRYKKAIDKIRKRELKENKK